MRRPHSRPQSARPGIALLLSLVAIIIVGGIASAIAASALIEQRSGDTARRQNQAFAVADAAAGEIIGNWNSGVWNQMAIGAAQAVSGTSPEGTGTFTGSVTRINSEIFLVDVTGRDRRSQARQRLAMLVKLRVLAFDATSALTTRGAGTIGGSAIIDGTDLPPWPECPPAGVASPGIRHPQTSQLNFQGSCSNQSCVTGSPKVLNDPVVSDNTFFNYGDRDWADLAAAANVVITPDGTAWTGLGPTVSDGQCDRTNIRNWGEPDRPGTVPQCAGYFPTMYVNGDILISGGRGQGILLVNGDLTMQGGFEFTGIVIVRDRLRTAGTGAHIHGGVLAANVDLEESSVLGNATMQFSRCAIQAARLSAAPGALFRSRGWSQVF